MDKLTKRELLRWIENEIDVGEADWAAGRIYDKCMEFFINYVATYHLPESNMEGIRIDLRHAIDSLINEIEDTLSELSLPNEDNMWADLRR